MPHELLIDLYELTMVAGYVRRGMHGRPAVFDLYFRRNPFQGGYAVFAGLEPALDHLEALSFGEEDLRYLEGLKLFDRDFIEYLRAFRFRGRVVAAREGEVMFANEPLLSVEATIGEAQLVETALLNLINYQTLIATKAARIAGEAGDASVVEFGARRAPGPDGALSAARAAFVGGASRTSNLEAGLRFGIGVAGTQAHSWVMAFEDELAAFRAYAEAFPRHCVLLVDTYDTLRSGIPNAIVVAREMRAKGMELRGVRLDSGDLAYLSRRARGMLDEAGFHDVRIIASNEMDEEVIESVRKEGGCIDSYGVGTRLVTGAGEGGGALGGVYKLVEFDGAARIKVSADPVKSTIPGRKHVWRVTSSSGNGGSGRFELDVLSGADDAPRPGDPVVDPANPARRTRVPRSARLEDLRRVVMEGGRRSGPPVGLPEIADYARQRLARLPEGCRRLLNPHVYRVALTRGLHEARERMIERVTPALDPDPGGGGGEGGSR